MSPVAVLIQPRARGGDPLTPVAHAMLLNFLLTELHLQERKTQYHETCFLRLFTAVYQRLDVVFLGRDCVTQLTSHTEGLLSS